MKTFAIVVKKDLTIGMVYKANEQRILGGPWNDPEMTIHVEISGTLDPECLQTSLVDGEYIISENAQKKQKKALLAARAQLNAAKQLGQKIIEDFTIENMAMGITADNMTNSVRKTTAEVVAALGTGSLYDAIHEARQIPESKYDSKYVTAARLLEAINKIEAFLGITLSEEL